MCDIVKITSAASQVSMGWNNHMCAQNLFLHKQIYRSEHYLLITCKAQILQKGDGYMIHHNRRMIVARQAYADHPNAFSLMLTPSVPPTTGARRPRVAHMLLFFRVRLSRHSAKAYVDVCLFFAEWRHSAKL